jgi:hypothetical protein
MGEIRTPCSKCARIARTEVDESALNKFMLREGLVQTLFKKHTVNQREAIMGYRSGFFLCPTCWDIAVPDDEEE